MLIQRIADAVMELFTGVVVLSRATRSLNANSPTADHELKMVKLICQEVCTHPVDHLHTRTLLYVIIQHKYVLYTIPEI